jgi:hypothetical protein
MHYNFITEQYNKEACSHKGKHFFYFDMQTTVA